jgi:hypothetical protein
LSFALTGEWWQLREFIARIEEQKKGLEDYNKNKKKDKNGDAISAFMNQGKDPQRDYPLALAGRLDDLHVLRAVALNITFFVSTDCANTRLADTLKAIPAIYKKNAPEFLSFFLLFWFAGWASAQIVFTAETASFTTAVAMTSFGFFLSMLIIGMSFYYLIKISSILNVNGKS